MAIRLAFNLALHVDMSSYVFSGVIAPADADLRRMVFWAAYTVDQYDFLPSSDLSDSFQPVRIPPRPALSHKHGGCNRWQT